MSLLYLTSKNNFFIFAILFIVIFIIYFNIFNNEFIFDDEYLIVNNIFIRDFHYIKDIFTTSLHHFSPYESGNFYRPIQTLSYLFDYHLWGFNTFGYHLTNILFHLFNAILIFLLINTIFKDRKLSLLVSLFFAICPFHVSAVTYISGRTDLLVAFFILLALLFFIKAVEKNNNLYYVGSLNCFLLALLSKEFALIFPFILLLTHIVYQHQRGYVLNLKDAIKYLPFVLFSLAYIILRLTILNFNRERIFEYNGNFYLSFINFSRVIFSYIKLIFFPTGLYFQHNIPAAPTIFATINFLSVLAIIFILIVIVITYKYKQNNFIFWSLSWFLVTLLPVYFVMTSYKNWIGTNLMMAENWLYIPVIGFFTLIIFITLILNRLKSVNLARLFFKKIVFLIMILLIFSYAIQTIKINGDYKNNIVFFSKMVTYHPDFTCFRLKLADAYLKNDDLDEAIEIYRGITQEGKIFSYGAHVGLGTAYFKKSIFDKAIEEYKMALNELDSVKEVKEKVINKARASIFGKMGRVYFYQGHYDKAEGVLLEAIEINSLDALSYAALGVVYAQRGQYQKAIEYITKSLAINPYNPETFLNLGLIYANMGNIGKAKEMWRTALKVDPNYIRAKQNLIAADNWLGGKP